MGRISVGNIDDSVLERLEAIARDGNTSLDAVVRRALEREARRQTASELCDALRQIENLRQLSPPSERCVPMIRQLREDGPDDE